MLEDCKFWRLSLGERAYTRLGVGFENFESLQWINISKKTLYCSFLWMGCNCLKTAESTSRGFTFNQLEGVPHIRRKAESTFEPPKGFQPGTPGLGFQRY